MKVRRISIDVSALGGWLGCSYAIIGERFITMFRNVAHFDPARPLVRARDPRFMLRCAQV